MRRSAAFTLVELLVVIGIIAVLIAILLPTLSGARRQANTVKCLSNLRQIGMAFQLYERQYKGMWPVFYHHEFSSDPDKIGYYPPGHGDRSWIDFIAPFVVGQKVIQNVADINAARQQYEQMKCPVWDRRIVGVGATHDPWFFGTPIPGATTVLIGYAMHYHPIWYEIYDPNSPNPALRDPANLSKAIRSAPGITRLGPMGKYLKAHVWGRNGSQRGLICDSDSSIIYTLYAFRRSQVDFQPFLRPETFSFDGYSAFTVDALRHARPPRNLSIATRRASVKVAGMNMLYCDGHVATINVMQAWNAIHNPGQDRTTP